MAAAVERLGVQHPSRTILLVAEPGGPEASIEARVETMCSTSGERPAAALRAGDDFRAGEAAHHLPAVIDPILLAELPDFLWWLGEPPFSDRLHRMVDLVNRLIIDSATFTAPAKAMNELAEMVVIPYGVALSDFAWDRLRPWRELVAQFFDPPEYAPCLGTVERVDITYEPGGDERLRPQCRAARARLALQSPRLARRWVGGPRGEGAYHWSLSGGGRTVEVSCAP